MESNPYLHKKLPTVDTSHSADTNWCVLTGPPCSGKTTILNGAEDKGFRCVTEAARVYIERQKLEGRTHTEICSDLAQLEKDCLQEEASIEATLDPEEVCFLDLALPDSLTYFRTVGLDPEDALQLAVKYRYRIVFIFDSLPWEDDGVRYGDEEMRKYLKEQIPKDYIALGYRDRIVNVPVMPHKERLQFVLDTALMKSRGEH